MILKFKFFSSCTYFKKKYEDAKSIEDLKHRKNRNLEDKEFVQEDEDLGYERTEIVPCRNSSGPTRWFDKTNANQLTTTARLIADLNPSELSSFDSYFSCVSNFSPNDIKPAPKYRPINGFGANSKNPYFGSTGVPYGRLGPKNYYDNIHTLRASVSAKELPHPRSVVQNVLMAAQKYERTSKIPNDMANFAGLYVTHDIAALGTVGLPKNKCEDMRCCTSKNRAVLSKTLQNSACLPIPIADNDPFYKEHGVRCLNFIRSQLTTLPNKLQYGEIKNKATGFLDLSLVYGNDESETYKIRSNKGKLYVNSKNYMATNANGDYTGISDRMLATPMTSIWPALFTRNHNKLADELARLNPKWKDEQLFQEARRINIAILQNIVYNEADFMFESRGGEKINEAYDENVDVASTVEFHTAAFR